MNEREKEIREALKQRELEVRAQEEKSTNPLVKFDKRILKLEQGIKDIEKRLIRLEQGINEIERKIRYLSHKSSWDTLP